MGLERQKIIRASRLSLTCIFVFLLTWYYEVPESAWSLITIWFVMYEYNTVGGVYTKSLWRFSGTFASAVYGMIVVYCCGNDPVIDMAALVAGLFVYAYYFMGGDKVYIGTIGAVTLTIVLLNYNDIDTTILRVLNIFIGVIGSMFMIRFFYPQYARDKILGVQSDLVEGISHLLEDYLDKSLPQTTLQQRFLSFDHGYSGLNALFNRFIIEAKMETKKAPCFVPDSIKAMDHLKAIIQLLGLVVGYLSTEDLRSALWVQEGITFMLSSLKSTQHHLLGKPISDSSIEDIQGGQNAFCEQVLKQLLNECRALEDVIKKLVCIYDVYDVCIDKG